MVTTSFIWRHVDPDRPARTVIRTALTDWRRRGAASGAERRLPRLVARRVTSPGEAAVTARPAGGPATTSTGTRARTSADYYDDAPVTGRGRARRAPAGASASGLPATGGRPTPPSRRGRRLAVPRPVRRALARRVRRPGRLTRRPAQRPGPRTPCRPRYGPPPMARPPSAPPPGRAGRPARPIAAPPSSPGCRRSPPRRLPAQSSSHLPRAALRAAGAALPPRPPAPPPPPGRRPLRERAGRARTPAGSGPDGRPGAADAAMPTRRRRRPLRTAPHRRAARPRRQGQGPGDRARPDRDRRAPHVHPARRSRPGTGCPRCAGRSGPTPTVRR